MSSQPRVSVMVAAFNAQETLPTTLNSVAEQTWRPIQVVIIDDGSTDSTPQIISRFSETKDADDFRLCVHRQPNRGLLAARRKGLELCTGSHLQVLDADDLIHPQKFRLCLEEMERSHAEVVVPHTSRFQNEEEIADQLRATPAREQWSPRIHDHTTTTSNLWRTAGPLFKRSLVDAAGGFETEVDPVIEELEFHARIKLCHPRVSYMDEILSFYRTGRKTALTGEIERLYRGRIAGVVAIQRLLEAADCKERKEWSSLMIMAMRNVYQTTARSCGAVGLAQPACNALASVLKARRTPWGLMAPLARPGLLSMLCRAAAALPVNVVGIFRNTGS